MPEFALRKRTSVLGLSQKNRRKVRSYFGEYCEHTTIHGFQYLGEENRSCFERVWWVVTLCASIAICFMLILQTYNRWERSPVIVSFSTKQLPVFDIPFPAITICPEIKTDREIFNYTKTHSAIKTNQTLSDDVMKNFNYISLVCQTDQTLLSLKQNYVDREDVLTFLDKVAPKLNDTIIECYWLDDPVACDEIFTPVITEEGVCYSFNMLDRSEIYKENASYFKNYSLTHPSTKYIVEDGYKTKDIHGSYPRRAPHAGVQAGLEVILKAAKSNVDYTCGRSLQGYKIVMHHTAEVPSPSLSYFSLPLKQAVVAAVTPSMLTTTKVLYEYSPAKRHCYFQNEKSLRFFKVYTQDNCEIECLANYTAKSCKCVEFYMPNDGNVSVCGPSSKFCLKTALVALIDEEINSFLEQRENLNQFSYYTKFDEFITLIKGNKTSSKLGREAKRFCNCLPSCNSVQYSAETSQSKWHGKLNYVNTEDPAKNFTDVSFYSMLIVYFKNSQFIPSERDELYGPTEFLANCGGLLGLFIGLSCISIVEVVYFLTVRLCCNIKLHGMYFWNGGKR